MFKLEIKLFGIELFLNISKSKSPINANHEDNQIENSYDENNEVDDVIDEPVELSDIQLRASVFEQELKQVGSLYDIPDTSDIPPKHQIQDDVEIITDSFEKEYEDIIEGRR